MEALRRRIRLENWPKTPVLICTQNYERLSKFEAKCRRRNPAAPNVSIEEL